MRLVSAAVLRRLAAGSGLNTPRYARLAGAPAPSLVASKSLLAHFIVHAPATAVNAIRIAARITINASIASSARGCVRTLTAAPTGDASSAETKTIAASGGSTCAVAALPMKAADAAQ